MLTRIYRAYLVCRLDAYRQEYDFKKEKVVIKKQNVGIKTRATTDSGSSGPRETRRSPCRCAPARRSRPHSSRETQKRRGPPGTCPPLRSARLFARIARAERRRAAVVRVAHRSSPRGTGASPAAWAVVARRAQRTLARRRQAARRRVRTLWTRHRRRAAAPLSCGSLAELPQPQKYPPLHGPVGTCSPGKAQKWPGMHGDLFALSINKNKSKQSYKDSQ